MVREVYTDLVSHLRVVREACLTVQVPRRVNRARILICYSCKVRAETVRALHDTLCVTVTKRSGLALAPIALTASIEADAMHPVGNYHVSPCPIQ